MEHSVAMLPSLKHLKPKIPVRIMEITLISEDKVPSHITGTDLMCIHSLIPNTDGRRQGQPMVRSM